MTRSPDSWFRQAVRRFTLGSGPLKRGSDRVQMVARLLVVLAFLAAPPLAVLAATATATHLQHLAAAQAADRYRANAVVLMDAAAPGPEPDTPGDPAGSISVQAQGRWVAPTGQVCTRTVLVPAGTPAGAAVPIWANRQCVLTRPPLDPVDVPATATAMALAPLLGVPVAAWACYAVLCAALDARRDRRWTEGWAAVEPDWGAQLP
jgi:hypothetical protein